MIRIADWENIKSYDYLKTTSLELWIWEFVRRDNVYQYLWLTELKNHQLKLGRGHYLRHPRNGITTPDPRAPIDSTVFAIPYPRDNKWGFKYLFNPTTFKPIFLKYYPTCNVLTFFEQSEKIENKKLMEDIDLCWSIKIKNGVVIVDLTKPIKAQLAVATRKLVESQAKLQKLNSYPVLVEKPTNKITPKRRADWGLYLRCLDAKIAGIRREVAAQNIFGSSLSDSSSRIWDEKLKQAKTMQKHGVINILNNL